jgi:hypothetical protein
MDYSKYKTNLEIGKLYRFDHSKEIYCPIYCCENGDAIIGELCSGDLFVPLEKYVLKRELKTQDYYRVSYKILCKDFIGWFDSDIYPSEFYSLML